MRPNVSVPLLLLLIAAPTRAALPPLIPRAVLFSNPSREAPQISPDGRKLSYVARSQAGVLNLWLRPLDGGAERQLTEDREGDIAGSFWAADSRHLLFLRDSGGDENYHLFSLDLDSGLARDLTPYPGSRAENVMTDAGHPSEILVGINLRDKRVSDIHRVSLETGTVTLEAENPGDVVEWAHDSAFAIRAAVALDSASGNTVIRVRDAAAAPWRTLQVWPFEEAGNDRDQRILGFTPDGHGLRVLSPMGANTTRILSLDLADGRVRDSLPADPRADVWCPPDFAAAYSHAAVLQDPASGAVQAYAVNYLQPEWKVVDPALRADFDALARAHPGVPTIEGRDDAGARWVVGFHADDGPVAYYLYDRGTRRVQKLFVNFPEFERLSFAHVKPVTIRARDGLALPAYLTLPVGIPARKLPLMVVPHGGPWFRDQWFFDPYTQWLANRGYAVLQVNYRGSTGYGKAYINASIHQVGPGAMQRDLTDAVRWAIREGIADSARVGVMGASYGGYATLCGLAFTPELYTCGVDVVGPSNLKTLIESFPPYWGPRKRRWLNRIGDVIGDEALNRKLSPLYHVEQIRAPLLIGHGANDPRAKLAESEQMVRALREHGKSVTFVVYPDEGHGFARPENNQDFNGRVEEFLAKHLRGRCEPWKAVKGSSAEVR